MLTSISLSVPCPLKVSPSRRVDVVPSLVVNLNRRLPASSVSAAVTSILVFQPLVTAVLSYIIVPRASSVSVDVVIRKPALLAAVQ